MKNSTKLLFILLVMGGNSSKMFAQALNFGAYSYITLGTILSDNHSYTKEAWVKVYPTSAKHGRNFISSYDHPFWLENGVLSAANRYGSYPHTATLKDVAPFPLNTWVHIAVTYDAHCSAMTLYRNGQVVAVDSSAPPYTMGTIQLGATGSGDFLDGVDMDEVRIWGVALSQAQIQANMNCDVRSQDGLLAYYKFDEGKAGAKNTDVLSAIDYSGHSNNGLFSNFSFSGNTNNYIKGRNISSAGTISGATAGCIGTRVTLNDTTRSGTWSCTSAAIATISQDGALTGISNGSTVISYTLNNGCFTAKTLNVYTLPTISASIASEHGDEGNNGSITTTVTGGKTPYQYAWSNNTTTANLTGIKLGTYRVAVTDAHGCSVSGAYIVTRPASADYPSTTTASPATKSLVGAQQP